MRETRSDGLLVRYDDVGEGEPALLCLPGWCATRRAFDGFATVLAPRRRLLSVDWRGHGDSEPSPHDFGFAELLRDAIAVIEASGAKQIVPVATAHAGWAAIALRRALGPARVPKLILIDWIVTAAPPPFLDALAALQDGARTEAARDRLFAMWTDGVDDAAVLRYVHEDMGRASLEMWSRAGREIAAAYARESSPLAALARLSPSAPTLHLYAQPRDDGFLRAQQELSSANPWFSVQRIDARSHFPTIEAPSQLAGPIERFLAA